MKLITTNVFSIAILIVGVAAENSDAQPDWGHGSSPACQAHGNCQHGSPGYGANSIELIPYGSGDRGSFRQSNRYPYQAEGLDAREFTPARDFRRYGNPGHRGVYNGYAGVYSGGDRTYADPYPSQRGYRGADPSGAHSCPGGGSCSQGHRSSTSGYNYDDYQDQGPTDRFDSTYDRRAAPADRYRLDRSDGGNFSAVPPMSRYAPLRRNDRSPSPADFRPQLRDPVYDSPSGLENDPWRSESNVIPTLPPTSTQFTPPPYLPPQPSSNRLLPSEI